MKNPFDIMEDDMGADESEQALCAVAAGAGFIIPLSSPLVPSLCGRSHRSNRSSKASVKSHPSSAPRLPTKPSSAPRVSSKKRPSVRLPLRSYSGRLCCDVRPVRSTAETPPVQVEFKLSDRTTIPRALLSQLNRQTGPPADLTPDGLRMQFTSIFIHGTPIDVFVLDDGNAAYKGCRQRNEGTLSLADFCLRSGGIARLQADGEVLVEFPT